jgi:uncharacterized protein YbjT (DUF2867 family)
MTRVLVTGGNGLLGREVVRQLGERGYVVRVMSRRAAPETSGAAEWAQGDVVTGAGLPEAVAGADVIIHAASAGGKNLREVEVGGTGRLLALARAARVAHFVFVSIVGVEQIPYPLYRYKVEAENLVRAADVPWSILRATQFHNLIEWRFLEPAGRRPLFLMPTDFKFQPIDPSEVAARLVEAVASGPGGRLPDIGGPEVLTLGRMAQIWMDARGARRPIIHLPLPGRLAAAFRHGRNTCPSARYGRITWAEWAQRTNVPRPAAIVP